MRVRVIFAKTETMRYTGHLDLFRTWERTIRRARLPLAYTQGYRPRPRINLASALPLGITSQFEVMDMWLEESVPENAIHRALHGASPPGIDVLESYSVEAQDSSLQSSLVSAEYEIIIDGQIPTMTQKIDSLMDAESWISERRGKKYDLRPLIEDLRILGEDSKDRLRLVLRVSARENATGRPDEVIRALGGNLETAKIHRTNLIFDHNQPTNAYMVR